MPSYRYYTADLLTGQVLADLPLYGVAFDRQLGRAGNFTGTFKLQPDSLLNSIYLDSSNPSRTAIYVERDDTLIWGGIIWSRTYQAQSKTCQITAQTFESYVDHVVIENDFVRIDIEQLQVFKDLLDALQAQNGCDIGLDTSDIVSIPSGQDATVKIPHYEYHFAREVTDALAAAENSFDWMIDIVPSGTPDMPNKYVRVGHPKLGEESISLVFDYPGNIDTYWWPESGTSGGTKFAFIGAGAGSSILRAEQQAVDLLNVGYPAWWVVQTDKNLATQQQVSRQVAATRDRFRTPVVVPTFQLKPDRTPPFDAWSALGAAFKVHIEDVRFPDGKDVVSRMIGWSLLVADGESTEILKFIVEGDSDAAV